MKTLVISFTDLSRDPRAFKHIKYLQSRGHDVTTLGTASSKLDVEFLSCQVAMSKSFLRKAKKAYALLFKQYESIYWSQPIVKKSLDIINSRKFDLIIANDVETLPLALKIGGQTGKVILDAHEYSPKEFEDQWKWRLLKQGFLNYLCKKYLSKANWRYTVCDGIINEYEKNFGVSFDLLTSAPFFQNLTPQPLKNGKIRMIYHGIGAAARSIEDVIKIMNLIDERFTLDIILIPGDSTYIEKIKKLGKKNPRINFLDPVSMLNISSFCNQYDIGFFPLKPLNLNYYYCLSNKFFEFMQARVAIAVSPLPEMKKYVEKFECGFCSKDFSPKSFAQVLNSQTSDSIWKMKQGSHKAASIFCAEENFKKVDTVIERLF